MTAHIDIRPLDRKDLDEADRIFRVAFGTFLGMPDPTAFMGDADLVRTRWKAEPSASLGAYHDGALVGSNFAARWGSFGFLGPLTVRPDLWDRGIARKLMDATMELFGRWGTRQLALFTFPHSPKHLALYQRYGFWPQRLTAVLAKPAGSPPAGEGPATFCELGPEARAACLARCRAVAEANFPGLDLTAEVRSVADQSLGDTVLLRDGGEIVGFAVCHAGPGSEAGSGAVYVKFGAVHPGPGAEGRFERLVAECELFAARRGAQRLLAGANTARARAYRLLLGRGYRAAILGVAMQRPDEPGYNLPDRFVIDDWR